MLYSNNLESNLEGIEDSHKAYNDNMSERLTLRSLSTLAGSEEDIPILHTEEEPKDQAKPGLLKDSKALLPLELPEAPDFENKHAFMEEDDKSFTQDFYDKVEIFLDDEGLFIASPRLDSSMSQMRRNRPVQLRRVRFFTTIIKSKSHMEFDEEEEILKATVPTILARRAVSHLGTAIGFVKPPKNEEECQINPLQIKVHKSE